MDSQNTRGLPATNTSARAYPDMVTAVPCSGCPGKEAHLIFIPHLQLSCLVISYLALTSEPLRAGAARLAA